MLKYSIIVFGHYSSSNFFYLKHAFQRLDSVSDFRWNVLSWAQFVELVPISGQQQQHKMGYINQTQHKLSARVKTNIDKTASVCKIRVLSKGFHNVDKRGYYSEENIKN
jgi:hypothetical protein